MSNEEVPTLAEWMANIRKSVDTVIEDHPPRIAYENIRIFESAMNETLLYIRRKRIQLANRHGFKR